MLVELQCYWELRKTDIFMFGTPFIPLAKIHCFLETNKFLSKKTALFSELPVFLNKTDIIPPPRQYPATLFFQRPSTPPYLIYYRGDPYGCESPSIYCSR